MTDDFKLEQGPIMKKYGYSLRVDRRKVVMRFMFNRAKATAKFRRLPWDLTIDEFDSLSRMNCYYCDAAPSCVARRKGYPGEVIYNGLDRIDSSGGYVIGNVFPACKWCNQMKMDMPLSNFISQCKRIASHCATK